MREKIAKFAKESGTDYEFNRIIIDISDDYVERYVMVYPYNNSWICHENGDDEYDIPSESWNEIISEEELNDLFKISPEDFILVFRSNTEDEPFEKRFCPATNMWAPYERRYGVVHCKGWRPVEKEVMV